MGSISGPGFKISRLALTLAISAFLLLGTIGPVAALDVISTADSVPPPGWPGELRFAINTDTIATFQLGGIFDLTQGDLSLSGDTFDVQSYNPILTSSMGYTLTGANGFTVEGTTGVLTLGLTSNCTGTATINSGTLRLGGSHLLNDAMGVAVNGSGVFDLNGNAQDIGSLTGTGNVTMGGGTLYTVWDGTSTTYSGTLSGGGALIKDGFGTWTVDGSLSVDGLYVGAGGLSLAGSVGVTSDFYNNGTFDVLSGGTVSAPYVYNEFAGILNVLAGGSVTADYFDNRGYTGVAGSVNIASELYNYDTFDVLSGGSLTAYYLENYGSMGVAGSVSVSWNLYNYGLLEVLSGGTVSTPYLSNDGGLSVASGGSVTADHFDNRGYTGVAGSVGVTSSLDNYGTLEVLSGGTVSTPYLSNDAFGTLDVAAGGSITADYFDNWGYTGVAGSIGTTAVLFNTGTLEVLFGGTVSTLDLYNGVFGTLDVAAGGLVSADTFDNWDYTGVAGWVDVFDLYNDGTLDVEMGGWVDADYFENWGYTGVAGLVLTSELSNYDTLEVLSGGLILSSSLYNDGDLSVAAGGLVIADDFVNSSYTGVAGSVDVTWSLDNYGTLEVLSGGTVSTSYLYNTWDLIVAAGGSVSADTFDNWDYTGVAGSVDVFSELDNYGTLEVLSGGLILSSSLYNDGGLSVASGGSVTTDFLENWSWGYVAVAGSVDAALALSNYGILEVLSGGTVSTSDFYNDTGAILTVAGGGSVTADLIESDGYMEIAGAVDAIDFYNYDTLNVLDAGSITADWLGNDGNMEVSGDVTVTSELDNYWDLAILAGGTVSTPYLYNGVVGALTVSGGTITADLIESEGYIGAGGLVDALELYNYGILDVFVGGSVTADWLENGGYLRVEGWVDALELYNSGALDVFAGGTVYAPDLYNDGGIVTVATGGMIIAGWFGNLGETVVNGSVSTVGLYNYGTLDVSAGGGVTTSYLYNDLSGGLYVRDGGSLSVSLIESDGYMEIAGSVDAIDFYNYDTLSILGVGSITADWLGNDGYMEIAGSVSTPSLDNYGDLLLGASNVISDSTALYVESWGTFDLNDFDETIGSLSGWGTVQLGTGTLTMGRDDSSTVFGGVISGSGSVVKEGTGTFTFVNSGIYTGGTIINSGALIMGTDGVMPPNGALVVNASGTFDGNGTYQSVGSLAGSGAVVLGSNGSLEIGSDNTDTSFAGTISGWGYIFKTGTGTLTLTGSNSYSGGMSIYGGTLVGDTDSFQVGIYNNAALVFDQGFDGTYSGIVSGSGSLTKTGAGTLTLTGDCSVGGGTAVNSGVLAVDGLLISDVTVNSGGTISGNGTIEGSYILGAGAVYAVEADSLANSDRLLITGNPGTITLGGGTVDVQAAGTVDDYNRQTFCSILQTANGVTGEFEQVTLNLDGLAPYLLYDGLGVTLLLHRDDIDFADIAETETDNQESVAEALTEVSPEAISGDMSEVLNVIADELTPAERREAYDAIGGQTVHTSLPVAALEGNSQFVRAIGSRLGQLRVGRTGVTASAGRFEPIMVALAGDNPTGLVSGPEESSNGVWVRPYFAFGSLDGDSDAGDYDYNFTGAAVGFERRFGPSLVAGLSGGYGTADLSYDDDDNEAEAVSGQFGLYGGYTKGPFYMEGVLSYALSQYETSRRVVVGTIDRVAKADYDGVETGLSLEGGYGLESRGFDIQPMVSFQWSSLRQDGFTEEGADSLNLTVDDQTIESVRLGPGFRVSYPVSSKGIDFIPEVRGRWVHEFGDSQQSIDARLAGGEGGGLFSVDGIDIARDSIVLGAGLTALVTGDLSLGLDYNLELRGEQTTHAIAGALRYAW